MTDLDKHASVFAMFETVDIRRLHTEADFGAKVLMELKRIGMTQAELADRSGIVASQINRVVHGLHPCITLRNACRIADALGVSMDTLTALAGEAVLTYDPD
jgi:transcriptional regulator with XRE-family HTH domain